MTKTFLFNFFHQRKTKALVSLKMEKQCNVNIAQAVLTGDRGKRDQYRGEGGGILRRRREVRRRRLRRREVHQRRRRHHHRVLFGAVVLLLLRNAAIPSSLTF